MIDFPQLLIVKKFRSGSGPAGDNFVNFFDSLHPYLLHYSM